MSKKGKEESKGKKDENFELVDVKYEDLHIHTIKELL